MMSYNPPTAESVLLYLLSLCEPNTVWRALLAEMLVNVRNVKPVVPQTPLHHLCHSVLCPNKPTRTWRRLFGNDLLYYCDVHGPGSEGRVDYVQGEVRSL